MKIRPEKAEKPKARLNYFKNWIWKDQNITDLETVLLDWFRTQICSSFDKNQTFKWNIEWDFKMGSSDQLQPHPEFSLKDGQLTPGPRRQFQVTCNIWISVMFSYSAHFGWFQEKKEGQKQLLLSSWLT